MQIKAIQTKYKGYHFRSRTEARWAVFFDAINWKWQYEEEGYKLPSGPYLPDFYFPDLQIYAEVKGNTFTELERLKCRELSTITRHNPEFGECLVSVLLLDGPPALKQYEKYENGYLGSPAGFIPNPLNSEDGPLWYGQGDDYFKDLKNAIDKALSARF